MTTIIHPTLRLLNQPVVTYDGDFQDLAEASTVFGPVRFARSGKERWSWCLVYAERAADDFDFVSRDAEVRGPLSSAVKDAEGFLELMIKKARKITYESSQEPA